VTSYGAEAGKDERQRANVSEKNSKSSTLIHGIKQSAKSSSYPMFFWQKKK
jgi:hypothetical protein